MKTLWEVAKGEIKVCKRCEDWEEQDLGGRCPSCDHKILKQYDRLLRLNATRKITLKGKPCKS